MKSSEVQETQVIDNYTSWFSSHYGVGSADEEPASLFDICYLYPVPDLDPPPQETAYQVEHRRRSEYDYSHWLSEYDSCWGRCWGEDLFPAGRYSTEEGGCNEHQLKAEDSNEIEDQYQSYTLYSEDEFNQPDSDYNPWSCHQYFEDDDSYSYIGDEPRTTSGYRMDELGLSDVIFGYFPCLLREQQQYYNMR